MGAYPDQSQIGWYYTAKRDIKQTISNKVVAMVIMTSNKVLFIQSPCSPRPMLDSGSLGPSWVYAPSLQNIGMPYFLFHQKRNSYYFTHKAHHQ